MIRRFDPAKVRLTFNGKPLEGAISGDFVEYERDPTRCETVECSPADAAYIRAGILTPAEVAAGYGRAETDEEFRARVLYVAGDGTATVRRIMHAEGQQLDDIAAEFELRRLRVL